MTGNSLIKFIFSANDDLKESVGKYTNISSISSWRHSSCVELNKKIRSAGRFQFESHLTIYCNGNYIISLLIIHVRVMLNFEIESIFY